MIKPTVGRVVLFHPSSNEASADFTPTKICAAIIAYVHSDSMVNLAVFDGNGVAHSATSVFLFQDGETPPADFYCEWMPSQKGQAAKTEQAESDLEAARRMASAGKPLI